MTSHVTVVIPTTGRNTLTRAVRSALDQETNSALEIIVVWDAPEPTCDLTHILEPTALRDHSARRTIREIVTGGGRGGSAARNLGVEAATSELVAFLDDDDVWTPGKIENQIACMNSRSETHSVPLVLCSRIFYFTDSGRLGNRSVSARLGEGPKIGISLGQDPFKYLFTRRGPTYGRPAIPTSSLLLPTEFARATAWTEGLSRHQDWDFLIRLWERGCNFLALDSVDVGICVGSEGSISASGDWRSSLNWAQTISGLVAPDALASFLVSQCLRYAVQARDFDGVRAVVRYAREIRAFPDIWAILMCLAGLVPRDRAFRAASVFAKCAPWTSR